MPQIDFSLGGGCGCCGGGDPEGDCPCCSDEPPEELTVVISGIAGWDGEYTVVRCDLIPGATDCGDTPGCEWRVEEGCGPLPRIVVRIGCSLDPGQVGLGVELVEDQVNETKASYSQPLDNPTEQIACQAIDYDIPWANNVNQGAMVCANNGADYSTGTVHVTA